MIYSLRLRNLLWLILRIRRKEIDRIEFQVDAESDIGLVNERINRMKKEKNVHR